MYYFSKIDNANNFRARSALMHSHHGNTSKRQAEAHAAGLLLTPVSRLGNLIQ